MSGGGTFYEGIIKNIRVCCVCNNWDRIKLSEVGKCKINPPVAGLDGKALWPVTEYDEGACHSITRLHERDYPSDLIDKETQLPVPRNTHTIPNINISTPFVRTEETLMGGTTIVQTIANEGL